MGSENRKDLPVRKSLAMLKDLNAKGNIFYGLDPDSQRQIQKSLGRKGMMGKERAGHKYIRRQWNAKKGDWDYIYKNDQGKEYIGAQKMSEKMVSAKQKRAISDMTDLYGSDEYHIDKINKDGSIDVVLNVSRAYKDASTGIMSINKDGKFKIKKLSKERYKNPNSAIDVIKKEIGVSSKPIETHYLPKDARNPELLSFKWDEEAGKIEFDYKDDKGRLFKTFHHPNVAWVPKKMYAKIIREGRDLAPSADMHKPRTIEEALDVIGVVS